MVAVALQSGRGRRPRWAAILVLVLCCQLLPARGDDALVTVPVSVDYGLLRQLLVSQLFNTADQSRELLDDPTACNRIVLTDPQLSPRGETLELVAGVNARLGVGLMGNCSPLLNWRGEVGLLGRPVIEPGATAVRLEPQETWLIDSGGGRVASGNLWEVADSSLKSLIRGFSLDLTPHIDSLGRFLPEVLPRRSADQLQAIVDSLALNAIDVAPEGLQVAIDFRVAELPAPLPAEAALTAGELQQLEDRWQMMDALLVYAVKRYAAATPLAELRGALLEVLIDSRYRLRDALTDPAEDADDQVRQWFIQSWQRLQPVIRRIAVEQEGQEQLLWLTVVTATDALNALDQLGPGMGLDISEHGLRRLARLINDDRAEVLLQYDEAVDPELQKLFREQLQAPPAGPSALRFNFSFFPAAVAAAPARLNSWAPARDELDEYLPQVASLLDASAGQALQKYELQQAHQRLFRKMVLTTAWQESCWRQYVVTNSKLEPLRSGTGDVGLMQINERVWRGFYDIQKLRWDIDYNSRAGAEVLLDYLVKYAIRKGEQKLPGGLDNLARASYSAYNGGPSQVSRYRRTDVPAGLKKVDAAFWSKYQQVNLGNELKVAECLGGEFRKQPAPSGEPRPPADAAATEKPSVRAAVASDSVASRWVQAQPGDHYTLQVGAFSEAESAVRFIVHEKLAAPVHVYPWSGKDGSRYLVLMGSFPSRESAEPLKQKLARLQPWLRSFASLRQAADP